MNRCCNSRWPLIAASGLALLLAGLVFRGPSVSPPGLGAAMLLLEAVSATASTPLVVPGLACLAVCARRYLRGRVLGAAVSIAVGGVLVWLLKALAGLPRPEGAPESLVSALVGADLYGWPSGHSMVAGAVLYYAWGTGYRVHALLWAGLVAASRVLLGSHYPGDVASGLGLGLAVAAVVDGVVKPCGS